MHFHCMTLMDTLLQKNPYPRDHEIHNFNTPFRCHHYYAPQQRGFFFEKYIFYTFHPKITPPLPWVGVMKYNFSFSFPKDATYQNLVKISPGVLEKKMLTDDSLRTITDAIPQQQVTRVTLLTQKFSSKATGPVSIKMVRHILEKNKKIANERPVMTMFESCSLQDLFDVNVIILFKSNNFKCKSFQMNENRLVY